MALVADHTLLAQGTEFDYDVSANALSLSEAGDLVEADGVTIPAIYSAIGDEHNTGTDKWKERFPFDMSTGELGNLFEVQGGYTFTNHSFLRSGGARHRSGFGPAAAVTQEYMCLVGLGSLAGTSPQCYVLKNTDTVPTNLARTGLPNELVKIYDSGGDDDRASMIIYVRLWGYSFIYYDLTTEQSISGNILPVNYNVPMTTVAETNGSGTAGAMQSTAYIDANTPYTGMGPTGDGSDLYEVLAGAGFTAASVETLVSDDVRQDTAGRWFICTTGGTVDAAGVADYTANGGTAALATYTGEREVDGTYYAYNKIIECNSGTNAQIWEFHQRSLIKTSDVASGETQRGDTLAPMLEWVNGKLRTATGVFLDNGAAAEAHLREQTDAGGTQRTATFVPTLTVNVTDSTGSPVNAPTGARLRINDETNANELHNATTIAGSSSVGVNYTASGNATIKIEWNAVNGTTNASLHKEATLTMTDSANQAVNIVFEDNTVYVANGVDGSAVTGLSINSGKVDVDANRTSDTLSWQQIFNWYCYYQNTEDGMRDSDVLMTFATQTSGITDPSFQIRNTKASSQLTITGAIVADSNGSYTNWADLSTGNAIFSLPSAVVPFSSGSVLSGDESTALSTAAAQATAANANTTNVPTVVTQVDELHELAGLDAANPVTFKDDNTEISSDGLGVLASVSNGDDTHTVTRTP